MDEVPTKKRILFEATRLFAQKGYAATSIREICRAAGVNKPSVYYHFGDKKSLYRAAYLYACQSFVSSETILSIIRAPKCEGAIGRSIAMLRQDADLADSATILALEYLHPVLLPELKQFREMEVIKSWCSIILNSLCVW